MTTTEVLCRHFSRMGARLKVQGPAPWQDEKIRIDVGKDRNGEFFNIHCQDGCTPEVLHVEPASRHLVLLFRDGPDKNKFLLGHDERHWFVAAVPGARVRDVGTAKQSLRPTAARSRDAIRQGEWFFVPAPEVATSVVIHHNEPIRRGPGSKPHICEEVMRYGGTTIMVSSTHPAGISEEAYRRVIQTDPEARRVGWRPMTRDAVVFARGRVRHPDHATLHLDGWHRVYLNREGLATHSTQIAFFD